MSNPCTTKPIVWRWTPPDSSRGTMLEYAVAQDAKTPLDLETWARFQDGVWVSNAGRPAIIAELLRENAELRAKMEQKVTESPNDTVRG